MPYQFGNIEFIANFGLLFTEDMFKDRQEFYSVVERVSGHFFGAKKGQYELLAWGGDIPQSRIEKGGVFVYEVREDISPFDDIPYPEPQAMIEEFIAESYENGIYLDELIKNDVVYEDCVGYIAVAKEN